MVLVLTLWADLCVWCEVGGWISSFAKPFVKKMILSLVKLSWPPCWNSIDHTYKTLFLDSQLYSSVLQIHSYFNTTVDFSSSAVNLKSWSVSALVFSSFSDCFSYPGSLAFLCEFWDQFINFFSKANWHLVGVVLNLHINLGSIDILLINIRSSDQWNIFPLI